MELADDYVSLCDALLNLSGMSHPLAHLNGGLAIYIGVQFALRTRRASGIALQAVFGAEIVNEILQRAHYGSWRVPDTMGDIATTVFWPTLLYAMAKYRRSRWKATAIKGQAAPLRIPHATPALLPVRASRRRVDQSSF